MKRGTRRNPNLTAAAIGPFLPYIIIGTVIYFFGDKLFAAFGAKLTGIPIEEYKKDIKTVTSVTKSDALDVAKYVGNSILSSVGLTKSIETKLAEQKAATTKTQIKIGEVPRPANWSKDNPALVTYWRNKMGYVEKPLSQTEFNRNRAILQQITAWG